MSFDERVVEFQSRWFGYRFEILHGGDEDIRTTGGPRFAIGSFEHAKAKAGRILARERRRHPPKLEYVPNADGELQPKASIPRVARPSRLDEEAS